MPRMVTESTVSLKEIMVRPCLQRNVCLDLKALYFKPRGIPMTDLAEVVLEPDEMEAVRLADRQGLYQQEAAAQMGISRQTFGNIIKRAHEKIANALIEGKALRIDCPCLATKLSRKAERMEK